MRSIFLKVAAWVALAFSPLLNAQTYPDRAVKIINPFPGGPTDTYARLLASKLQRGLGQPFIVDGRPGAGGIMGVTAAAKSTPDGYTLLVTSASTQVVQPVVRKSIPYDAEKDFIPIIATGTVYTVVVVRNSLPVSNLDELIAYANANAGKLSYGSSGIGTALHLAGEVFAAETGIKLLHVPYKTAAQSMTDLLGGQVDMMFDSPNNSAPHISSGKLKAIAIMGPERTAVLPDVKSTLELGRPSLRFENWLGLYAPAGTPPAAIRRLTEVLLPAMQDPDIRHFFDLSAMPYTTPYGRDFAESSRLQRDALAKIVRKAGIPKIE